MTLAHQVHDLVVADLIHVRTLAGRVHRLHADKRLSQRNGPEPAVEKEQALQVVSVYYFILMLFLCLLHY